MDIIKPITVARNEFVQDLVNLCNNSGLPFFVLEDILKNLTQEVHAAAQKQLEDDTKRYQEQLKKQTEE